MSDKSSEIEELIEAICKLSQVNRLTGIWDHVRFEECKKTDDTINYELVVKSERNSRKNVELRAYYRRLIDDKITAMLKEAK